MNETMTDARALDFIRVYLAPYRAHGEKDQVVEHIAARLRGEAAPEQRAVAWAVYAKSDEWRDPVILTCYMGTKPEIVSKVMAAARREGFTGTYDERMAELGWWIEPLYTHPQPAAPAPVAGGKACVHRDFSEVEDYISKLRWSDAGTDEHKMLVAGNLRSFYSFLLDGVRDECPDCQGRGRVRDTDGVRNEDCDGSMICDKCDGDGALYAMSAPVAGDAVAALPAKWRAKMPSQEELYGDWYKSGQASAYDVCVDELEAALAQDRASQGVK